jgi:ABC-type branched-subunit amino acid transport system substrate-binding protein
MVFAAVGLVLVAAAGWGINILVHACGSANSGVTEIDGECVGVTDGSYVFDPAFADVEAKIAAENAAVKGSGHTVTIALLSQLTANQTSARSIVEARNELEGAYTAQHYANQPGKLGDAYPLIRLVLANEGSHEGQWQPVVHQLEGLVDDKEPLVAVTGLGVSITPSERGAMDLAAHGIPMVAAIATADELSYTKIHGFIRVVPSTREHVARLADYLQRRPELDSAILVYDANSDDPASPDLFTRSLREDLNNQMSGLIKYPSQSFTGASGQSSVSPGLFSSITANICAVKPKLVFYAGRQLDLRSLLASLKGRVCTDAPMTVLTVAIDLGAIRADQATLRDKKITVAYASATDPHGWANQAPGTPEHFRDFMLDFCSNKFDLASMDGGAITTHDALFTAIKAVRLAVPPAPSSQKDLPKPVDVLNQLLNLNNLNTIPGASGNLSFSYRGNNSENPTGKPIPVVEIPSTETEKTCTTS